MRDTLPTLLHSLDIGVWQATLPLQYVEPDPTAAGQFGISSAGPIDFEAFLERVDEKDRERFSVGRLSSALRHVSLSTSSSGLRARHRWYRAAGEGERAGSARMDHH